MEAYKTEATSLATETDKLKENIKEKDDLNDIQIARVNSLEEALKKKEERNDLLEPLISKFLSENKRLKECLIKPTANPAPEITDQHQGDNKLVLENTELKNKLKECKTKLETAKKDKSTLANELAKAQEKLNGGIKETSDKCVNLSNELKTKSGEIKVLERENKFLTDNLSSLQKTLNEKNNKISEVQTLNIRLENFNKKMYELCERKDVFNDLEATNAKELNSQNKTFENNSENRNTNKSDEASGTPKVNSSNQQRCWFWENGLCKKGDLCDRFHHKQMCTDFKHHGKCSSGDSCPNRHPVQVCRRFLNSRCPAGDLCVHQHPVVGAHRQQSLGVSSPESFLVGGQNIYNRPDPSQNPSRSPSQMNPSAPSFRTQQYPQTQPSSQTLVFPYQSYPQTTPLFIHPSQPSMQQIPGTPCSSLPYPPNPHPLPVHPMLAQPHLNQPHQPQGHVGPQHVWGIHPLNHN